MCIRDSYYFAAAAAAAAVLADFDCDDTRCYAWILAAVLFLADRTEADALAPDTPTSSTRFSTSPYTKRDLDLTFLTNSRQKNATLAYFHPLKS